MSNPNQKTVTIKIEMTEPVVEYLRRLVRTGLWGKNIYECAGRLVERGVWENIETLCAGETAEQNRKP